MNDKNVEIQVTAEGAYRVEGRDLINNSPDTLATALTRATGGNRALPLRSGPTAARCINPWSPPWTLLDGSATGSSTSPRYTMGRKNNAERASLKMPPAAWQTYKRLLTYLRPHKGMFAIGVLGMTIFAATDAGWAAFVKFFLDGTFVTKDPRMIWLVPSALVGLFVLRGVGDYLQTYCPGFVGRRIVKTLRGEIFHSYVHLPISYFDTNTAGVLLSKLTYNTEQVAQATTDSITVFIRDSLTILGLIGYLLYLNPKLTAVQPDRRPADRVPDPSHQSTVPALQSTHPEFDGRRHARGKGGHRGAPRDPRVQRPGIPGATFDSVIEHNRRSHMKLMRHQGDEQSDRADDRGDRSCGRALSGHRRGHRRQDDCRRVHLVHRGADVDHGAAAATGECGGAAAAGHRRRPEHFRSPRCSEGGPRRHASHRARTAAKSNIATCAFSILPARSPCCRVSRSRRVLARRSPSWGDRAAANPHSSASCRGSTMRRMAA